ncbi:VOC family protein [Myxococcaceae bacterium JPH2]|nr:VOC family protein [Myxococcaceae bacterium JPH2]
MNAVTIPMLPCVSLTESLGFYRALGFSVTYQQVSPNPYAVVQREDVQLHLFGQKGLNPAESYASCLIVLDEIDDLHEVFLEALRRFQGKVPVTGIPRIARKRKGQSRFHVVDPGGNWLRFVKRNHPREVPEAESARRKSQSKLMTALQTASKLRDFKGDDAAAAKVLDAALARAEQSVPLERARVLLARAELASVLGEPAREAAVRAELSALPLSAGDREQLADA